MFAFESWLQFTTPESCNIHEGTDQDECVPLRVAFQVTNSQRRTWHSRRKDTVEEQNKQPSLMSPEHTLFPHSICLWKLFFTAYFSPWHFPQFMTSLNTGSCDQPLMTTRAARTSVATKLGNTLGICSFQCRNKSIFCIVLWERFNLQHLQYFLCYYRLRKMSQPKKFILK